MNTIHPTPDRLINYPSVNDYFFKNYDNQITGALGERIEIDLDMYRANANGRKGYSIVQSNEIVKSDSFSVNDNVLLTLKNGDHYLTQLHELVRLGFFDPSKNVEIASIGMLKLQGSHEFEKEGKYSVSRELKPDIFVKVSSIDGQTNLKIPLREYLYYGFKGRSSAGLDKQLGSKFKVLDIE